MSKIQGLNYKMLFCKQCNKYDICEMHEHHQIADIDHYTCSWWSYMYIEIN